MKSWANSWEVVRQLGAGGQGTVDLVVSKTRSTERQAALEKIIECVEYVGPRVRDQQGRAALPLVAEQLAKAIHEVNRPNRSSELGALKRLHMPAEPAEYAQALGRFRSEIRVLGKLTAQPGILKSLDADESEGWMVTEYHERGTLEGHPGLFKGDALGALRAFLPLVEVVARLHEDEVIHRDIKPENIFLGIDGELLLGDFGIVFWADDSQKRMTETYERVGSRDWMAPWANRGRRLAEIKPSFDIFPLGKVLWSMISGQAELPFWYWADDPHNLERLFPGNLGMNLVNSRILAKTVVERETSCVTSAADLKLIVKAVISMLERGGELVAEPERPCRVCGIGYYKDFRDQPLIMGALTSDQAARLNQAEFVYKKSESRITVKIQTCDCCGHVQLFNFPNGDRPQAWVRPDKER